MASEPGGEQGPAALFQEVVDDPESGSERVPRLLSLLDGDDEAQRLSAAWALTLLVNADDALVEPVARRLADRLAAEPAEHADGDRTVAVRLAFGYLQERYPDRVESVVSTLAAEAEARAQRERYETLTDGFVRNEYFRKDPGDSGGGGGKRLPGEELDPDERQLYQEEGESIGGAPADAREDEVEATSLDDEDSEDPSVEPQPDEADGTETVTARRRTEEQLRTAAEEVGLDRLAEESRFDDLQLVQPPVSGRYTDIYRVRAVLNGSESGIALRVFSAAGDRAELADIGSSVAEGLAQWSAISDHAFVASLYAWGADPEPWLATTYASTTLYDRSALDFDDAIWNAIEIAEAVAAAHERGVVHTGLDPYSVVYTDTVLDDRQKPLVTNFGLVDALRSHLGPTDLLDPRYAAPEYFDSSFGRIDPATDVYQMGAVIYKLVTGQAPFRGEFEAVRAGVLERTPTRPTAVEPTLPSWVDDVVEKAMAKRKLTRYESMTDLTTDLRRRYDGG